MGSSGGGGTQQSSVTNQSPWIGQQEFLRDIFSQAQGQAGQPLSYFPGSTVGGQSSGTLESQQAGLGLVRGAGQGAEYDYMNQVLGGDFLNLESNPYLRAIGEQGASDITRHYQTAIAPQMYMGGGRSGSGAEGSRVARGQQELGDSLGDFYNNLYGGQYAQERGHMQNTLGLSAGLRGQARGDIQLGNQLGGQADVYDQRLLDDLVARFQFEQDEPGNRLDRYSQRIQGGGVIPGISIGSGSQSASGGGGLTGAQGAGLGIAALGALASAFSYSSKEMKDEVGVAKCDQILERLRGLDIPIWHYNEATLHANPEQTSPHQHLGPYAEDWHNMFGLGDRNKIFYGDGIGICLAAIKALLARVRSLEEKEMAYG